MKKILVSEDAFGDLNEGFLFYEAHILFEARFIKNNEPGIANAKS
jgi:hypothetical protein